MPKQSDFDRINRLVVVPLATFYGTKFTEGFIDAMVEDLCGYNDDALQAAVLEVRRTCKTTPRIAHLVEACKHAQGANSQDSASTQDYIASLRKRDDDARRMAKEFMDMFIFTEIAQRARKEGWESYLFAYAYEAAWLQAQNITRSCNPGFNHNPIVGRFNVKKNEEIHEIRKRCEEFVSFCKRQAATGIIEISVPNYLIDEWKAAAKPMESA